uniref:Putative plant transposon protein domain-containing protein n=1 Tax=Solanum tuberosum TaxID=4113 RepID=M1DA89_SOLTU
MAPKGNNVASGLGTKRSRKGVGARSSSREPNDLPPQKFGGQAVMHYGKDWYECQQESKYLGDEYVDEGVRDTGHHLTLHYGHFNLEARIWLKIVCSTLLPCKHTIDVTRERLVLIYGLMKGLPVNVGDILKQNMLKFRTNKRWCFCYGSIITRYLRALLIEEEVHDVCSPRAPHLVCHLVDVTRTKAHDPSQGLVLTAIDRQARDDSWMGRMFGMAEL